MVYVKSLEKVMPKFGDIITNEMGCFLENERIEKRKNKVWLFYISNNR